LSADLPASVRLIDLTDARARFGVSGPLARKILAAHTAIDTEGRAFKVGASAPTDFGHVAGQLTRLDDERFEILTFSTYAADLAAALAQTATSAGAIRIPS
jgi:heterotetrameric sarcosine oxidase gamma subunit